jgi:predicted DNA-binding protein YlxM (UPF0122 family)
VPTKLNDTQVLELVTRYANGTSISALAKDYNISRPTVTRYIDKNADLLQKITEKKEESITQWLESNKGKLTGILNQITELLPEKLKSANARELFGGLKILTDLGINISKDNESTDEAISVNITFADTSENKNE